MALLEEEEQAAKVEFQEVQAGDLIQVGVGEVEGLHLVVEVEFQEEAEEEVEEEAGEVEEGAISGAR